MENNILNMGEIIRDMRKAKGITQDALAHAAGVSIQAVSKWETGQSLPDVTLLPAIADFFHTTTDVLFGRDADPAPIYEAADDAPNAAFPDDDKLRVVQYLGSHQLSAEECADEREIRLLLDKVFTEPNSDRRPEIIIEGSARLSGPISTPLRAGDNVYVSGNVNGPINAGNNIVCEGMANGPVRAGASITYPNLGKRPGSAETTAIFADQLPDDDVLRVVQVQGRRILSIEESADERTIRLCIDPESICPNVTVYGSAHIEGTVEGSLSAGDSAVCGNVGGSVTAGDAVTCESVGGSVTAGEGVRISGDVQGSVTAERVSCAHVGGKITAEVVPFGENQPEDDFKHPFASDASDVSDDLSSLPGGVLNVVQVLDGKILSAEACDGHPICLCSEDADGAPLSVHLVQVHGNVQIDGEICGDLHIVGMAEDVPASLDCSDISGDLIAQNAVIRCGDIQGDITIQGGDPNASLECGSVAGDLQLKNAFVKCDDVEGDVTAYGSNPDASLACGCITGDLQLKNLSVKCDDIEGDVNAEGSNPNASLACGNVSGDLQARGVPVECGDVNVRN